jgi:molybdopterin-synthase adenylyltransferase
MAMRETKQLTSSIKEVAVSGKDPAGNDYRYLTLSQTSQLAGEHYLTRREVELAALNQGIIPDRYQRSIGTLGVSGQAKLLESSVGVVGAGGLGGFVLELLARMGVGKLLVVDGDSFTDSNLNRQLFSSEEALGCSKVETAVKRIAIVNSATEVEAYHLVGDVDNLPALLEGCDLVIDCLDNLPSRFALEKVCSKLGIILIHGAIAGFLGQVAVIRPEKPLLEAIYGPVTESGITKGVEVQLGNPAATPAMLASWQASEAVKILAELEGVLAANKLLIIDMHSAESYQVEVTP